MSASHQLNSHLRVEHTGRQSQGLLGLVSPVTTTKTLTFSDPEFIEYDASGGAFSIYLPANPYVGCVFQFAESADSGTAMTIDGNGETIAGAATLVLSTSKIVRQLRYNGTEWRIIGGSP